MFDTVLFSKVRIMKRSAFVFQNCNRIGLKRSLTKIRCHDFLVFRLLFPGPAFLPRWGRCDPVEEGPFGDLCLYPGELRRGVRGVVGPGRGPRVWAGTHLRRARHGHVGPVLRHGVVVQPAEERKNKINNRYG